jgi:hypothetical protein
MSDLAIVRGISRGIMATLADGTIRVKLDFEPTDAAAAFAIFGMPGSPVAVARLAPENTTILAADTSTTVDGRKPVGGPLARLAGMWCAQPAFAEWLSESMTPIWKRTQQLNEGLGDHELAAICVRSICRVSSRSELDHDLDAGKAFLTKIRLPYMAHIDEVNRDQF